MPIVRALTEADLPQARHIVRLAFGTFLGVPDLDRFWADQDYVYGRFGAEHTAGFAAEEDGTLLGSNFATRWGSVGFFGPLSTRPDRWNGGCAQPLVAAACEQFERWRVGHAGLFTFAQSAKHVHLYRKFGFYPRFLTAIMSRPAQAGAVPADARHSLLAAADRMAAEDASYGLTDEIHDGLDLRGEIRTVAARGLGDTLLLRDGSRLAGFAICHWGPASEAGGGNLYIKFAAVRPGNGAAGRFAELLRAAGALAAVAGMANVLAGVNLAREEAYGQMAAGGFRTEIQGVAMHRGNAPGYSRPGVYVLDDWR
ncbi:MAG TPA: GNAT family N-acetyltransferase [Stellaceae bacterium]|nr:GNAT family N-acetyltransferase [Stellaceae bacterium]